MSFASPWPAKYVETPATDAFHAELSDRHPDIRCWLDARRGQYAVFFAPPDRRPSHLFSLPAGFDPRDTRVHEQVSKCAALGRRSARERAAEWERREREEEAESDALLRDLEDRRALEDMQESVSANFGRDVSVAEMNDAVGLGSRGLLDGLDDSSHQNAPWRGHGQSGPAAGNIIIPHFDARTGRFDDGYKPTVRP